MKMNNQFLRGNLLKRYLYIILILGSSYLGAQTVTVSGNWAPTIPAITEAGNNYTGTYDNTSPSSPITISGTLPGSFLNLLSSNGAKITMHQAITVWNNSLVLSAKRTGGTTSINGLCVACTATINGGTTYTAIPQATDVTFVTITFVGLLGLGNSVNFSNINLQLQLSGVSVTIPAASYSTRVVFTVAAN
ncbi:hypothetical protein C1637_10660 [Chryseobacterium lactis]|uniref:Lipocalin-like domain-containing protein n=1 Tax=Chryseobacterium lactis TaxID=1241981 RepID=A0A3G6RVS4_CHRLC|nr:hypothetical protein [Chryseobacterium lactis]AZA80993.1 hypothetical protein EG342_03280 [Chryseobacterium lactis]AZB05994.1 hypothetical protein EG341_19405 [Chryseobacterium lactis]PNW13286.1 hypothetical protein C1637_10660 [Chryseobacterium lactis]